MPHSTYETDRPARSMTSSTGFTNGATRLGAASTNGSNIDNKWRRASLPVGDVYSDFNGGRTRSGSIVSNASNMAQTLRPLYHHSSYSGMAASRDRVLRNAPLIAELRTNVIIKDEYTLVTDLSYHLAVRYSKPDSSIMINIDHSSCLALAGNFDPCYILTLTTVPAYLGADSNRRNATLIQSFMADILSVPPDRGIIRFNTVAEENFAINSSTVLGELERFDGIDSTRRAGLDRKSGVNLKKSAADLESRANGIAEKEQRAARRRSAINAETTGEIFELAAESEGRPAPSATGNAEAVARSQTNPKENLKQDAIRNVRPKSVSTQPGGSVSAETFADARTQAKPKHISTVIKAEQKSAHMPTLIKPSRSSNATPNRALNSGTKSMTSATPTPITLKETIVDNPKMLKADAKYDSDTAANTAKRRSTITATPKMPAAPPVPDSKAPKVSKRKSFLSAFRRS